VAERATLNAIGLTHGTDKASAGHNYLAFYELFFAPLRDRPLTVLEIGVLNGASLRTWEDYFPAAKIVGADIQPSSRQFERDRVVIEILDQSNIEELVQVGIKHGPFDIIVEDGSHMWEHQITTLRTLFPFVKQDGIYIVEDLQTNYGPMTNDYRGVASISCVEYLKLWLDLRVADDQLAIGDVEDAFLRTYGRSIDFMTFYRRACLIRKQAHVAVRGTSAGQKLTDGAVASPPAVRVLAHVSGLGDVLGDDGFVNLGDEYIVQGLSVAVAGDVLDYRLRLPDGSWTDWGSDNRFVGTRGQAKLATGFTVRLRGGAGDRLRLRAFGRFAGLAHTVQVADGQDCIAVPTSPLCGIQIELAER
jgi:hypothetical protein